MKESRLIILILLLSFQAFGQKIRELGMTPTWRQGKIILKNQTVYKGEVYYNTHFGTIQYRLDDQREVVSIQEKNVQSMSFFDKTLNIERKYNTFLLLDTLTDREHEMLFEIERDYKNSAILSRMSPASIFFPINYSNRNNILHDFGVPPDKMFVQVEGIFFVDKRSKLELYSMIIDMDYDGLLYDYKKSKSKIMKEKLLKNFIGEHWEEIKEYMKQNKLKPKLKPDLLRILDQYHHLVLTKNEG